MIDERDKFSHSDDGQRAYFASVLHRLQSGEEEVDVEAVRKRDARDKGRVCRDKVDTSDGVA